MLSKEDAVRLAIESAADQQSAIVKNLDEAIKLAAQRGEYNAVVYCPVELTDDYTSVATGGGYTVSVVVGTEIQGRETDSNTLTVSWH